MALISAALTTAAGSTEVNMFNVGDKVWHINQLHYNNVIAKPFTIKDKIEYKSTGNVDYIVQLGQVHLLANASDLVKVVK